MALQPLNVMDTIPMTEPSDIVLQVDWTATGTASERRRRQNRINQRAQRHRRCRHIPTTTTSPSPATPTTETLLTLLASHHCFTNLHLLGPHAPATLTLLSQLSRAAIAAYASHTLRTDILSNLTRLNVWRALASNIRVLGLSAREMHDDALSPFCISTTWRAQIQDLPAELAPTAVQKTVPHHPWLDLLPIATLRDNLILLDAAGLLDDGQLCSDMCGRTGVLVWREAWDASGWEVTSEFLERWNVVVTGCWGLFASTNYWRGKRGERPIAREVWDAK